jgi:ATP-dependent helicase/nuclease subunit A
MSDINLKIISAGAGSGKTFRLTQEMTELIKKGVRTSGIIATTFTQKAAAELQERVRIKLLEDGLFDAANALPNAMIGTVHSIGVKLLQRFAFEAGVSPEVSIMAAEDAQVMFNNSLAMVLKEAEITRLEQLASRLGLNKKGDYDWRKDIRDIVDVARGNDFDQEVLLKSKKYSFESFKMLLPPIQSNDYDQALKQLSEVLTETIEGLQESGDETQKTQNTIKELKGVIHEIKQHNNLAWHQWAKLFKTDVSVKNRHLLEPLHQFAQTHEQLAAFQADIEQYIYTIFDIATAAVEEFQEYKKRRGLIDYTDMEMLVKRLLELEEVKQVLSDELDLLMVDEFQDTNPIQLDIFFKLSQLAQHSIWVGDPKQSIYGFRGADPRLMQAIVEAQGGVKKEDIQEHSYRSRKDIVHATNCIFAKAFKNLPAEQVALIPKREELAEFSLALKHWHFRFDGEGRAPAKEWFNLCIADYLKRSLQEGIMVVPKGQKTARLAQPCEVAILCRTNNECLDMADALHHVGLKAAITRIGLLQTAEAKLLLACLKYTLYAADSLSVAEILTLATDLTTAQIIEDRLNYVATLGEQYDEYTWAKDNFYIQKINILRDKAREFSPSEMLNLLIEELDLRRLIMSWADANQRLENVDIIRKMAIDYEDACNRIHSAASLGGFLLWLDDVANVGHDAQASGEQADAINILTYHRSKGLEWPITICHALENEIKDNVWGISLIPEQDTVDLNNLLGHRWMRFWVNPYNDQYNRTPLAERIENSDAQRIAKLAALEEEARLLYVGVTRARDYLIFTSRKNPTKWLNRTWHNDSDTPTLDPHQNMTEWEWNTEFIPIESKIVAYPREIEMSDIQSADFQYYSPRAGRKEYQNYLINLEQESFHQNHQLTAVQIGQYASEIVLAEEHNPALFAKALCHFYQSLVTQQNETVQAIALTKILQRFGFETFETKSLIQRANLWNDFLQQQFTIKTNVPKYPIHLLENKRLFQATLDNLIFTKQGVIALKHDAYTGERTKEKTQGYLDWAYWVKKALYYNFPDCNMINLLVHYPLQGIIMEIR